MTTLDEHKLRSELLSHIIATISDLNLTEFEELHYHAFNTDYYIIGYWEAEQWLKQHNINAFEAIATIIEWEENALGVVTLKPTDINPEKVVNLFVYIKGEEILAEFDLDQSQAELLTDLQEAINK